MAASGAKKGIIPGQFCCRRGERVSERLSRGSLSSTINIATRSACWLGPGCGPPCVAGVGNAAGRGATGHAIRPSEHELHRQLQLPGLAD
jgi:hypothetical protein